MKQQTTKVINNLILKSGIGQIIIHHLRTYFVANATGQQLADKLVSSLQENNISLKQVQALESD